MLMLTSGGLQAKYVPQCNLRGMVINEDAVLKKFHHDKSQRNGICRIEAKFYVHSVEEEIDLLRCENGQRALFVKEFVAPLLKCRVILLQLEPLPLSSTHN